MIKNIFSSLIVVLCSSVLSWSQTTTLETKKTEVYGTSYTSFSDIQNSWIANCYSRCEVILESSITEPVTIHNLSDVNVISKFVSGLTHDTEYNPETFNPLKYALNFHRKYDQYFRIGTTNYILKVHKKVVL